MKIISLIDIHDKKVIVFINQITYLYQVDENITTIFFNDNNYIDIKRNINDLLMSIYCILD